MLEHEKKTMLTEDEYISIVMLMCKYAPMQTQTYYYFDTEDFSMNKNGITCRIRAKDGKFKSTVKRHYTGDEDCSTEIDGEVKDYFDLDTFKDMGLILQGSLVTERIVLHKEKFCKAVIDRNTYLGFTDYELEIEYIEGHGDEAMHIIKHIVKKLSNYLEFYPAEELLSRVGKSKSKSERFFERKLKSRKEGGHINDFGFK